MNINSQRLNSYIQIPLLRRVYSVSDQLHYSSFGVAGVANLSPETNPNFDSNLDPNANIDPNPDPNLYPGPYLDPNPNPMGQG